MKHTAFALAAAISVSAFAPQPALSAEDTVRWKLASAYPGRMVQLGQLGKNLPKKLRAISGGKIRLRFYEPRALAPPLEYFDAIAKGDREAARRLHHRHRVKSGNMLVALLKEHGLTQL